MVNFDNHKTKNDQYQAAHLAALMAGDYGDVLMQYTGLKDKNGIEIYEGDLIKNSSGRIAKVNWHELAAMFDCEPVVIIKGDNSDGFKTNCWDRWVKVIGNIYEDRQLIE